MKHPVVLALLLLLPACSKSEPLALSLQNQAPDLQPVHHTLYSNIREPRRLLIRDPETWAAVWAEMVSVGDPRTPPFVDFARHDVVVAAMGERRVSGYSIAISGVATDDAGTRVIVTSTMPDVACDRAEIVSAPLDAVRIRKATAVIDFEERSAVRGCS